MKNIFENTAAGEKFASNSQKKESLKELMKPKIVVRPPEEEMHMNRPALSNRLSRHSNDTNSVTSSSSSENMNEENDSNKNRSPSSSSDSGSDGSGHRRNRSIVSLRRVFKHLNLTSRSQSSSPVERQRQPKKQTQPKRILRPPVTYTYVCGLSGLPTQRVPRHLVTGLNR